MQLQLSNKKWQKRRKVKEKNHFYSPFVPDNPCWQDVCTITSQSNKCLRSHWAPGRRVTMATTQLSVLIVSLRFIDFAPLVYCLLICSWKATANKQNTQTNKTHERLREVNGVQVMCGDVASNNVPLVYFDCNVSKKDLSCSLTKRRRNVNQLIVWIHMKLSRHLPKSNFGWNIFFPRTATERHIAHPIIANNITPKNVWVSGMTLSLKDSLRLDDSVVPGFSLTALKRKLPQSFTATPPHLTSF